ncbi:hypothetical protein FACS189499_06750 [Clostridia bacterium]|nr:hypothetical protein FACS189499_06750 [Clostridia bacterium]
MNNAEINDTFSYFVTGYYSTITDDPLFNMTSDTLSNLSWKVASSGSNQFDSIVCHSLVQGVTWNGKDYDYGKGSPCGDVQVCLGKSSSEALSAYLQSKLPDSKGLERLLNGVQYNCLQEMDSSNANQLIRFEEQIHERQFSTINSGSTWVLRNLSNDTVASTVKTGEWYADIQAINNKQQTLNQDNKVLVDLQQEVFSLWEIYIYANSGPCLNDDVDYISLIESLLTQADSIQSEADGLSKEIKEAVPSLNIKLAANNLELIEVPDRPHYLPNEPTVLLVGDGVGRTKKQGYQYDSDDGLLPCRSETISALTMNFNGKDVSVTRDVMLNSAVVLSDVQNAFNAVTAEAMLLSSDYAEQIAKYAFNIGVYQLIPRKTWQI